MLTLKAKLLGVVLALAAVAAPVLWATSAHAHSQAAALTVPAAWMPGMSGSSMPGISGPVMPGMSANAALRAQEMGAMNMAGTTYLYVWAGDAARRAPDRLAAIDFRRSSPDYGKVVGWAPVPGTDGIDNEPHHCMISLSMKVLACGGLLSVLQHHPGLFFFDISNPAYPRFMFTRDATNGNLVQTYWSTATNNWTKWDVTASGYAPTIG